MHQSSKANPKKLLSVCQKDDEYDIMISRVGCNAGKVFLPFQVRHNSSAYNYYIKMMVNISEFMLWWCNQPKF